MFMLGTQELVVILIIVLVLFGGKKIPEIMRGLGSGMREFRKASDQAQDELKTLTQDPPPAPAVAAPVAPAAAPAVAEQAQPAAAPPAATATPTQPPTPPTQA